MPVFGILQLAVVQTNSCHAVSPTRDLLERKILPELSQPCGHMEEVKSQADRLHLPVIRLYEPGKIKQYWINL